jgi:hypothetical protein
LHHVGIVGKDADDKRSEVVEFALTSIPPALVVGDSKDLSMAKSKNMDREVV